MRSGTTDNISYIMEKSRLQEFVLIERRLLNQKKYILIYDTLVE
jgi:hypothetical protein